MGVRTDLQRAGLVIDGREFVAGRVTGIGRVLCGLVAALAADRQGGEILLAVRSAGDVPRELEGLSAVKRFVLSPWFLIAELQLARLAGRCRGVFLSPYPKLPLFPCRARCAHIVHDVLYLCPEHGARGLRRLGGLCRLRRDLRRADLTWYDSQTSLEETRRRLGFVGARPRVRYPAIGDGFSPAPGETDAAVLGRLGLRKGYVLCVGNGKPHKNLTVMLEASRFLERPLVVAGVPEKRRRDWVRQVPGERAIWVESLADDELPALYRRAFCTVLPSLAEGYGYPPLESMACGTPAVVSDIAVLRETTGGCALFADPRRPEAWIRAIQALEDGFRRARISAEGLRWARSRQGRGAWTGYLEDLRALSRPERKRP